MDTPIKTRFFIISDTHGEDLASRPTEPVDVVVHCGDLTEHSKLDEFGQAIRLLKSIDASLKLVIAGNHDWTLDDTLYEEKLVESKFKPPKEDEAVRKAFGDFGEARALFEAEKSAGIVFLDEGTHDFQLANGSSLRVYASPFTPSNENHGGYPYDPLPGHDWNIGDDVDIAITHSPLKGVLDNRAGCRMLFTAIARARPLMHCFGHIHEAWGAKKVTWRGDEASKYPDPLTEMDGLASEVIQSLAKLRGAREDAKQDGQLKAELSDMDSRGYCQAAPKLQRGKQTLFVNAAIQDAAKEKQQMPWLVELELPRSNKQ
ncbi:Metallo-dependent phosphatase [Aureobasidium pullulans]|uniref:Metallo-dependent phosphatase n=1 Tax=Aureobasidium pullulans TaxID=5580 RepID=A0A4S9XUU7_AURPU|nr:Metallo-dependent phosphatase [Aureobasidium pullulans]